MLNRSPAHRPHARLLRRTSTALGQRGGRAMRRSAGPGRFLAGEPARSEPGAGRDAAHGSGGPTRPGLSADTTAQPATRDLPDAGSLHILLAEDDPMVARSTAAVLRRLGHTVTHALDGTTAWKCLQGRMGEFDVLLLDVVMPRMSGSDLAHRARQAGFAGRIILVSGLIMGIDRQALAILGIRRFMTKPFLPAELAQALSQE